MESEEHQIVNIKGQRSCQDCRKGLLRVRLLRMKHPSPPGSSPHASKGDKMNQGGQRGHTCPPAEHTRTHSFRPGAPGALREGMSRQQQANRRGRWATGGHRTGRKEPGGAAVFGIISGCFSGRPSQLLPPGVDRCVTIPSKTKGGELRKSFHQRTTVMWT